MEIDQLTREELDSAEIDLRDEDGEIVLDLRSALQSIILGAVTA